MQKKYIAAGLMRLHILRRTQRGISVFDSACENLVIRLIQLKCTRITVNVFSAREVNEGQR